MKLPSFWYVICGSKDAKLKQLKSLKRFGIQLVIWRKVDNTVVVMQDLCPHRSAQLSLGHLNQQGAIVCPFHGYEFTNDGHCSMAPEIKKSAPGLSVVTFQVKEAQGLIWIWWDSEFLGKKSPLSPIETPLPWFDDFDTRMKMREIQLVWKTHFSRCIENQLDYAHLPFVHKRTIGRGSDSALAPDFEFSDVRIKFSFNSSRGKGGSIEFLFGNIWRLKINSKLSQVIAFVPIDDQQTLLIVRSYQGFVTLPVLSDIVGFFNSIGNRIVIREDHKVVMSQMPIDTQLAEDEHLMPSDKAILHFRKQLAKA